MGFSALIPARLGSSRLPGKPLLDIAGKVMVRHVFERAQQSNAESTWVITDHPDIIVAVEAFGGSALMTSAEHTSGTLRLAEAAHLLSLPDDHIVVNVQGDEPLIPVPAINRLAEVLERSSADMATLATPLTESTDLENPNVVKVVLNAMSEAMYFSRAPIPFLREQEDKHLCQPLRHVGMYAYRCAFLKRYATWVATAVEQIEQLEQLRALYYGARILVEITHDPHPQGVDTMEDLERVRAIVAP
ncbi:MAG: 3-deoxy-manno-octulosonate cytidylyltransferase [Pseudomonadales bacterium]